MSASTEGPAETTTQASASTAVRRGAAGRALLIFAAIMTPMVLWTGVMAAIGAWAASLSDYQQPEGIGQLLFAAWAWNARMMPMAIVLTVVAAPLVSLAAAWILRRAEALPFRTRDVLFWCVAYVILAATALFAVLASLNTSLIVILFWATCAAQAVAIALAYRTQRDLHESGATGIPGYVVLWVGVFLQIESPWFGFVVAAVPLLCRWWSARRYAGTPMPAGDARHT